MSRFVIGNLFLILSMICTASSQILIKGLMDEAGAEGTSPTQLGTFLFGERLVRGGFALGLLGSGFVFWMLCLVRLDLSYAYPVACTSVLLVAYMSAVLLGEPVTLRIWAGTVLVLLGIVLLMPGRQPG